MLNINAVWGEVSSVPGRQCSPELHSEAPYPPPGSCHTLKQHWRRNPGHLGGTSSTLTTSLHHFFGLTAQKHWDCTFSRMCRPCLPFFLHVKNDTYNSSMKWTSIYHLFTHGFPLFISVHSFHSDPLCLSALSSWALTDGFFGFFFELHRFVQLNSSFLLHRCMFLLHQPALMGWTDREE